MTRKLMETLVLSLFLFAFLAVSASGTNPWAEKKNTHIPDNLKYTMLKNKLAGDDDYSAKVLGEEGNVDEPAGTHFAVGSEAKSGTVLPSAGVGIHMGYTTYDYQHNSRMTRMVAWRGDHVVHFDWMKKNNDEQGPGTYRMTAYQAWKHSPTGAFGWSTETFLGGKDLHVPSERSGYVGIDVLPVNVGGLPQGRAVPYNHYDLTGGSSGELNYLPTIWPDFAPAAGNFSTYKQDVPEELLTGSTTGEFIWPYCSTQISSTGDTVIHIVTRESDDNAEFSPIRYFRRVGPVDPADPSVVWTGFTIDTIATISYIVEPAPTSAPNPDKVAIVWAAHWPDVPGGPNSTTPAALSLLVEQNQNDVYCMISDDAGASWGPVHNISQTDSTAGGFVILGDMSGVIDTDGRLHVVWAARPTGPLSPGATGSSALDWEWPRFPFSSRVLHWSDQYLDDPNEKDFITVVKDGTWDWITEDDPTDDSICFGGAWHSMALNNPSISQCDDKLYVVFSQFQDLDNGVWDNCHERNFTTGEYDGSANGLLFFSVSTMTNGGLNWDPSRPLTGYTERCDTLGGANQCHSHFWHSTARYGMQTDILNDDFSGATVVQDPSWVYNSTDYYIDVVYVDDHNPGGVIQGEGGWTVNPFRWFRVPCVDPVAQPVLAIDPLGVFTPSWDKPGTPVNYDVTLFNIGNAELTLNSATPNEVEGPTTGWLAVNSVPATISEVVPNNYDVVQVVVNNGGVVNSGMAPAILSGNVDFTWESTHHTLFPVDFIVADTVQIPQNDTAFTNSISLALNNAGGLGVGIYGDTLGRMGFNSSIECDQCYNGSNNLSGRYLYDASPFVMKVTNTDTLVSAYAQSHTWLSSSPINDKRDGFRPINTLNDMGGNSIFNSVISSNVFYNADSTVALEQVIYAPKGAGHNGNFIGVGLKVYNISGAPIDTLYVGHIEDWDIPSDSSVYDGSLYDGSRQLMYFYGWETATADTFCGGENDCADADKRYGGSAFVGQFGYVDGSYTYNPFQQCIFSWKNSTYTYGGHIGYDSLYQQRLSVGCFGGDTYTSADPDSTFMDLMDIAIYGSYSLGVNDTLWFMKTMVSEYQDEGPAPNPVNFLDDVDAAVANLKGNAGYCCQIWGVPGDADASGVVNVLDIIYAINFKYKGGPDVNWPDRDGDLGPAFSCSSILDADGSGVVNVLDIIYLINYKYKGGPAPQCPL